MGKWVVRVALVAALLALMAVVYLSSLVETVEVPAPEGPPLPVPSASNGMPFPHPALGAVLSRFVDERGRVDYEALAADRVDLERYMVALASTSPHRAPEAFETENDQLAYWINAYNAAVLYAVTERPGLTSIADEKVEFFALTRYVLGGERVSLHSLENDIIRREFDEPRIHFALNCASGGCPELPNEAFMPDRLDEQLTRESEAFCADPDKVRLAGGVVEMSQIFQWYAEDFEAAGGPVAFCRKYGRSDLSPDAEVRFVPYDWSLNAIEGRGP